LLLARGAVRGSCLEELCVTQPELVTQVHRDYLEAGARLIRTHSFGANAARLAPWGLEHRVGELNWLAARIARDATKGTGALVAASVGPTGRGSEAGALIEEQLGALLDGGAQCVVFETFTDIDELKTALEVKQSLHHCAAVASIVCDRAGRMGGRAVAEVWVELRDAGADLLGVNCAGTPMEIHEALSEVSLEETAIFPSAGLPEADGTYRLAPEAFADGIQKLLDRGVRLIGGCCGTTPEHIAAVAARLQPAA
jgi:homocysteine S-methyltransferase